jgi:hypothetical protein
MPIASAPRRWPLTREAWSALLARLVSDGQVEVVAIG